MPIHLYKPIGLTPLELINKYKNDNNLNDSKFSFAGDWTQWRMVK